MAYWSEHTKRALPFNCMNTTQDKTKVLIDGGKSAQARMARINDM